MGIFEIVGGCVLILVAVCIIFFVAIQTEHSDGISGAIMGNTNMVAGKAGSNEEKLAKLTRVAAIAFFAITFIVDILNLL